MKMLYLYTVKPHFIAPRFTAKLAYRQEFLQSRFPYVVITPLKCQTRIPPSATVIEDQTVNTINCFHSDIYLPWLLVYLPWLTGILKSPRCDIIDWHYDRGLNNSKLTVWSLITVADGGMRVWHFNGVITTYGNRDCGK
jgi:hypothetical protein